MIRERPEREDKETILEKERAMPLMKTVWMPQERSQRNKDSFLWASKETDQQTHEQHSADGLKPPSEEVCTIQRHRMRERLEGERDIYIYICRLH